MIFCYIEGGMINGGSEEEGREEGRKKGKNKQDES